MKRGIALFLTLVLILGTLPATAFATGGTLEGEGTKDSPYQIRDAEDLMAFGAQVDEGYTSICGELLSSIDLTGYDWAAIGGLKDKPYSGTFDGHGYTVTLDITVNADWTHSYVGLFDTLERATVKNVRVEGKVTAEEDSGDLYLCYGGIAAAIGRGNRIENCSSNVAFSIGDASNGVGGIVGYVYDTDNEIIACANHGEITGTYEEGTNGYGGIVGWADSDIMLEYCYNSAAIHASGDGVGYAGGLIGLSYGTPTIVGCYTSASTEDNDILNPQWAQRTAAITSDYAAGDFFGSAPEIGSDLAHNMTYSEAIEGENGLNPYECGDGQQICRAWDYSNSVEDAVAYLNGDDSYYTVSGEMGDGWPVLAWELEKPASQDTPQEKALVSAQKAFDEARAAALDALDNGKTIDGTKYVGYNTYSQNRDHGGDYQNSYYRYSDENWEFLTAYYNTAKKELKVGFVEPEGWESMEPKAITADGERQAALLTGIADTALKNMAGVLTIRAEKEFAGKKLTAQQEISDRLGNCFEAVLEPSSEIFTIKSKLLALGARNACMSGSGSAVYGLFTQESEARAAAEELQKVYAQTWFVESV